MAVLVQPVFADAALTRSVEKEAARLAGLSDRPDTGDWRAVRRLDPDAPIVVTTSSATIAGRFHDIDEHAIFLTNGVDIRRVELGEVLMVKQHVRRGSAVAGALGTLGGLWLGAEVAKGVASEAYYGSFWGCGTGALIALFGIPVAAGYGAWYGTSSIRDETLYRRQP